MFVGHKLKFPKFNETKLWGQPILQVKGNIMHLARNYKDTRYHFIFSNMPSSSLEHGSVSGQGSQGTLHSS